jgi:outer membrane protein assembly factor BamE
MRAFHIQGLANETHRYNEIIIACLTTIMNHLRLLLARGWVWTTVVLLSACSAIDDPMAQAMRRVTPFRTEVVQGNFVSKEQVQALRPGMNRNQVKDILGTPLIASVFHADRWDYAFTIQRQGTAPQQRKLSVFFKNDVFERVEAKDLPSEAEFAARIASPEDRKVVPRLQATPEELEKFSKNAPAKAPAETAPAKALPKTYPPLEPSSN